MKKQYYTIYAECVKSGAIIDDNVGDVVTLGKIKSKGLAYVTCMAIQETMGEYYKVYFK